MHITCQWAITPVDLPLLVLPPSGSPGNYFAQMKVGDEISKRNEEKEVEDAYCSSVGNSRVKRR